MGGYIVCVADIGLRFSGLCRIKGLGFGGFI